MRKPSGFCLLCLAVMLAGVPACLLEEERPRVAVVVGGEAGELESLAASELASMLEKLFEVSVAIGPAAGEEAQAVILVGRPPSNPMLAEAAGESWPDLSDQGLVLRSVNGPVPTLLVGGGSPVAVLWAAYDLGERLGVRYLVNRDVFPDRRPWSGLPDLDLVLEPNLRIRCWRLVNDLPHGAGFLEPGGVSSLSAADRQDEVQPHPLRSLAGPALCALQLPRDGKASRRPLFRPPPSHRAGDHRPGAVRLYAGLHQSRVRGSAIRRRNGPAGHRTGSRRPEGSETLGDGDRTVHSALPVAQGVHEGPAGL